jgi:hypothetical protein
MSVKMSQVAGCVSRYSARLHAAIGTGHHVASPLGAWLLLALAGPTSTGADRATLTEVLGCDVDSAAAAAADLLGTPHPLVAAAAAVWTPALMPMPDQFERWRDQLPPQVTTGDLPGQAGLDAWAREHTFGLIDRFPLDADDVYMVLASALATKVSWQVPFDLAPAASLGAASSWAASLGRVLRTPARPGGHLQFIATTTQAGDVIVHIAMAAGGLSVLSAAALPGVPADLVLAAAHEFAWAHGSGLRLDRRDLASLPLGESPLWLMREVTATTDSCVAVLPAWSATSDHDLTDPELGFAAAKNALLPGEDPWCAGQAAMARYSRTGFEAAAVTGVAVPTAARLPGKRREAVLRFGHPYAVVAVTTDLTNAGGTGRSPWRGLPVFSAWVSAPEDATDDAARSEQR